MAPGGYPAEFRQRVAGLKEAINAVAQVAAKLGSATSRSTHSTGRRASTPAQKWG